MEPISNDRKVVFASMVENEMVQLPKSLSFITHFCDALLKKFCNKNVAKTTVTVKLHAN